MFYSGFFNSFKSRLAGIVALSVFSGSNLALATSASSTADGTFGSVSFNYLNHCNVSGCSGTTTSPQNYDTIFINHAVSWTGTNNWTSSTVSVIVVGNGGTLTPINALGGSILNLKTGAQLNLINGGITGNFSGNNSNHAIQINGVEIWGKTSCGGSFITLTGSGVGGYLSSSNPCSLLALPVNFIDAGAFVNGNDIKIHWTVDQESGIVVYDIKRGVTRNEFTNVGQVTATSGIGLKRYEFNDLKPKNTVWLYYQITPVNINYTVEKPIIVAVKSGQNLGIVQYADEILLQGADEAFNFRYDVVDMQGRILLTGHTGPDNPINIVDLTAGNIYLLRVFSEFDDVQVIRFYK